MAGEIQDARAEGGKKSRVTFLLIIAAILMVGLLGYLLVRAQLGKRSAQPTATPLASSSPSVEATATGTAVTRVVDEGVSWNDPEELDDLGLIEKGQGGDYLGTTYYKVGTTSTDGTIILAKVKVGGLGNYYYFDRFLKRDGKYLHLNSNSDKEDSYIVKYGSSVKSDDEYILSSLLPDSKIVNGITALVYQEWGGRIEAFVDDSSGRRVGDTRWGDLYIREGKALDDSDGSVKVAQYFIKLNDSTKVIYGPNPSFLRDDNTFELSFAKENAAKLKFTKMTTGGCGLGAGSFPLVAEKSALSQEKELGRAKAGAKVYYLDDQDNKLVRYGYEVYGMDKEEGKKSLEQFISDYGVVFWTDDYGSTLVFLNQDYVPSVECAKPVVYLYPERTMEVSVKVGARVTKSEPYYGAGWQAIARPNGQLLVGGQTYDSLFWEGLGYGSYPEITEGVIVARPQVEETIRSQLTLIGLKDKEVNDFLTFWLPKMPATNYVRLTWLTNQQMEALAPLSVSPKPDSLIRVFLDFQGLKQPINLKKQELQKYERKGFTVVEWGGLLRK